MNFIHRRSFFWKNLCQFFFIYLRELWNTDKEYHTLPSLDARCLWSNVEQEKNVKIVLDTRDLSRGADIVELRFIGFLNHGDVAVQGSLIDFSALTLASF